MADMLEVLTRLVPSLGIENIRVWELGSGIWSGMEGHSSLGGYPDFCATQGSGVVRSYLWGWLGPVFLWTRLATVQHPRVRVNG